MATEDPQMISSPVVEKSRSRIATFLILIIAGLVNAYLVQFIYLVIFGGTWLSISEPINILGITFPIFFIIFSFIELFLLSIFISKEMKSAFISRSLFYIAFIIFIIIDLGVYIVPSLYQQKVATRENPVAVGANQYNLSGPIAINIGQHLLGGLYLEGNRIVWLENTEAYPTYPENVWDIFAFDFSPQTDTGTITQLSNLQSAAATKPGSIFEATDGTAYWTQDQNLYVFDNATKKAEEIQPGIATILGEYNGQLLVQKTSSGSGNPYYDPLYWYDLTNKTFSLFAVQVPVGALQPMVNGQYVCFAENTTTIGRFDISSGQQISFTVDNSPNTGELDPVIVGCGDDILYYAPQGSGMGKYIAYQVNTGHTVFEMDNSVTSWSAMVDGGDLFYTIDHNGIGKVNLATGATSTVVDSGISQWAVSGDYLVYTGYGAEPLNLEPITIDPAKSSSTVD